MPASVVKVKPADADRESTCEYATIMARQHDNDANVSSDERAHLLATHQKACDARALSLSTPALTSNLCRFLPCLTLIHR
eukprot:2918096-Pleurochrysis_carterae.AAC.5